MKKSVSVLCHERQAIIGVMRRDHARFDLRFGAHVAVHAVRVLIKKNGVLYEAPDAVCPNTRR